MKISTMMKLEQMVDTLEKEYSIFTVDLETAGYIKELIECKNLLIQIVIEEEEQKEVDYNSYKNFNERIERSEKASDLLLKENNELQKELRKCRESYTELQRKSEEEIKNLKLINNVLIEKTREQIDEIKELKKDLQKAVRSYRRVNKDYDPDLSYDKFQKKILDSYKESKESEEY